MTEDFKLTFDNLYVSRETLDSLQRFMLLFAKWSKSVNLVAPSTLPSVWQRHIADSAQIFALSPQPQQWLDLGSGGGFPGIITAILLRETNGGWVHLVESNRKKAAFLRIALQETGARGSVYPVRIEDAPLHVPECQSISARALADLTVLLDYVEPWVKDKPTHCFFHKGRDYLSEIDKARGRWDFDLIQHSSAIEDDSIILEVFNISRKN